MKNSLEVTTITTIEKRSKIENIFINFISILTFIAFGTIAVISFLSSCSINPEYYSYEIISFQWDNIVLNIITLILFFLVLFSLNKLYNFFSKINMKIMYIGLFIYVTALGLLWIFSVWESPSADAANIFETSTEVIKGDYSSFFNGSDSYFSEYYNGISYYNFYPFQLGFVFICEMIYRIFGTATSMPIQVLNVLCTALAYCGIAKLSKLIFNKKSIEFITIVLLLSCFQPILFCSFPYGNIIGMCCAIWASYFLVKYLQTNKYLLFIPIILLIALAVMAKYNNLIYAVAFTLVLIIDTIRKKKVQSIAFALAILTVAFSINNIIIFSYEQRAGVKLEEGISQMNYLGMGLKKSSMAPGWYSSRYFKVYRDSLCNNDIVNGVVKSDIQQTLKKFNEDKGYALDFFTKKISSQWNEHTFESIWVSKAHYHKYEPNIIGRSVYEGEFGKFLDLYLNQYLMIVYLMFTFGLVFIFIDKNKKVEKILLPLILLGAFGYHLIFEAKSQYALTYLILLIPTAAYGIQKLFYQNKINISKILNKLKTIAKSKG